jgi:ATP-dependent DNA ligase
LPKQPRNPRAIKRATDDKPERIASRIVSARLDLRQAGLFDLPPTWIAPAIPALVRTAPTGLNWLHEIKHDGYRTSAWSIRALSASTLVAGLTGLIVCRALPEPSQP